MTVPSWQGAGTAPTVLQRWADLLALVTGHVGGPEPGDRTGRPGQPGQPGQSGQPGSSGGVALSPVPTLYVLRGRARAARGGGVHDDESGCVLPGLPVLQLTPASWWPGQVADWVARQLSHHAREQGQGVGVPVLTGRSTARGWDGEPLLVDVGVVAVVPPTLVAHAQRHHRALAAGRWPATTPG